MAGGGAVTFQSIQDEWVRKYGTRTDLALEAREVIVQHEGPPEIPGVIVDTEETNVGLVSRVSIETEEGSRALGKMPGRYTTIEAQALRQRDTEQLEQVAELIGREIRSFMQQLQVPQDAQVVVVGLGNWNATPDALGPRTIHHLVVTRHFYYMAPEHGRTGMRPVAGLSPGVLGITGIETAEIVQGLVRQIRPGLVVCVDALAARSTERLLTTIQIADAGIQPGSGVGNKRFGITRETLGVPVLAIGVPTVVHATTVVSDGLERLAADGGAGAGGVGNSQGMHRRPAMAGAFGTEVATLPLPDPSLILRGGAASQPPQAPPGIGAARDPKPVVPPPVKREVLEHVLEPFMGDLVMTPKEIDVLVEDVAETLAEGLNVGLHDDLDLNRLILSAIGAQ